MIEVAVSILIGAIALLVVVIIHPLAEVLDGIARHRCAQATSVLHHCGQLAGDAAEDDE